MGDVDGNGHDDLTVFDGSRLTVYGWNGGDQKYGVATQQPFAGPVQWAGMGDVDGNGHDDLTVFDGSQLTLYGWAGSGQGYGVSSQQPFG